MIGMTIAVLATVLGPKVGASGYAWIVGAMVVGAAVVFGVWMSGVVMTLWQHRSTPVHGRKRSATR